MSRILFAVVLAAGLGGLAFAQNPPMPAQCRADTLSNTNGVDIRLSSGLTYKTFPGPRISVSAWLPLDKLRVCRLGGGAVQITDLDRRGETVKALQTYRYP